MNTDTTVQIIRAGHDDIAPITATMIAAFFDAPDVTWLMPDPRKRATALTTYVPALLHRCVEVGTVHTTTRRDAAAVWWPHDAHNPDDYQTLVHDTCGPYSDAVLDLVTILAEYQPTEAHQYLAYLGVTPARQRRGSGSALLRHQHMTLDAAQTIAYLVATTASSRDLYQRHGYTPPATGPLIPPGGPPMWPMIRRSSR